MATVQDARELAKDLEEQFTQKFGQPVVIVSNVGITGVSFGLNRRHEWGGTAVMGQLAIRFTLAASPSDGLPESVKAPDGQIIPVIYISSLGRTSIDPYKNNMAV